MIRFLKARAIAGLEVVTGACYSRVIELDNAMGTIAVENAPDQSALRVVVRFPRLGSLSAIIARVRRMFDLSAEPTAIVEALSADPILAPIVSARPGLRLPGAWDGFETAVRAVLGQQITLKAATQLASRVIAGFGAPLTENAGMPELTRAFPRADHLAAGNLARLGIPKARAAAIAGIAAAICANARFFDPSRDLAEAVARLRNLPGIGEWTAQYIAMRALGETDAFLAADVALQRKFAMVGQRVTAANLLAYAERWRPWRAYAVMHLWMADPLQGVSRAS
jgi:AraC family transcriptional regulator of adaptative response / DNA-3-methyladenine glycosylase II